MKRAESREKRALIIYILFLLTSHFSLLTFSCSRTPVDNTNVLLKTETGALPSAILQTGEYPIWFQLTDEGPVYLESIEDAVLTAAFIPWPLAVHVRFFHEREDGLVMAVNRDGFMKLAPLKDGIALYHFSGGDYWKQYTIGGFEYYHNLENEPEPVVLLYLDNRFLDTNAPLPNPRTWTFNMESNSPFSIYIPALELFPAQEGWDADTLRLSGDGFWYYRVRKEIANQSEIQMIKTDNLNQAGSSVSVEDFFNSAPKEVEVTDSSLPSLPKGFVYTGVGRAGDSLFASWEEQDAFNIGAAGFMLIR